VKLRHAAGVVRVWISLIRDHVEIDGGRGIVEGVRQDGLRINAGSAVSAVQEVTLNAGHACPVIVGCNQPGVAPVLHEWKGLRRAVSEHNGQ
jgi:hypothetical protein